MSDFNPDLIAEALDEFHAAEAISPSAPGAAGVRAVVVRRRRIKAAIGALGVLLLAIPVAAFASHPSGEDPPPVLESVAPTEPPPPPPQPNLRPALGRDALFSEQELVAARVPVPTDAPAWARCPGEITNLHAGDFKTPYVYIQELIHPTLDADPALETVVLVVCDRGTDRVQQVVGYGIGDTKAPVPLGVLVPPVKPHDILELKHRYEGGFTITVFPYKNPHGPEPQERDFAWDGTAFRQVGGPAGIPVLPVADLAITSATLASGIVTVTVTNFGPDASDAIDATFGARLKGASWRPLQPGETKTYQVEVAVAAGIATLPISISSNVSEPVYDNNYVDLAVHQG